MIELIFTACLLADPGAGQEPGCQTRSRIYTEYALIQCMTSAQFLMEEWEDDHPGWQVRSHRCRIVPPLESASR